MCVIFACEKESGFPKATDLKSAESMNPHGAGIAWINEDNQVEFKKGLKAKDITHMIKRKQVSLPCIIHFRIGTSGGLSKALAHPFQICQDTNLALSGIGKDVLFHNGIYSDWENKLKLTMSQVGIQIPKGKWSDSRFMALLASYHGLSILNLLEDQKIAVMTRKGIKKYGDGWPKVDGITCSNDYFKNTYTGIYVNQNAVMNWGEDANLTEWAKDEKRKMDKLSKQIATVDGKLKRLYAQKRKIKKKGKLQKMANQILRLERKGLQLTNEREDFIQSSDTIDYGYMNDYEEDYNMQARSYNRRGWY